MNYVNMESWRCTMLSIRVIISVLIMLPLKLFSQQATFLSDSRLSTDQKSNTFNDRGPVVSLDTILRRIDRNNILLQTYDLRAEGYKYSAEAATGWMPPMIGAGTFMTPYPGQMKMPGDAGSLMFRIEQDIPNRARLNATKRYIGSQANIERATRAVTLNDYKAQSKRLYYNWIVAKQRISVLQQNERIMETMKKIEQVRYPYNQSMLGNVYKIEGRIEENRNMIRMQEGEINRARAYLNALMNRPGNELFSIDTNYVPAFRPDVHDTASLATTRGDILRMNESIRSMQLNIESMKQQKKPDFRIQYDHMYPLDPVMLNQYSVMGMISIPIAPWASKMYKNEVKAMQFNVKAMEKERAAMLQETQGMLYGMQYEIQSMEKRIRALEVTVIPSMQKSLEANFLNYQENKLQIPVVIDSWEALNMMQMNLLDEKLKLYQMIVDYEKELYR
jgi:outer membrane protein, heavy metal efflux system